LNRKERTIIAVLFAVLALGLTWTYYGSNIQGYIAGAAVVDVYFIDPPPPGHPVQLNYSYILMEVVRFVWIPAGEGEHSNVPGQAVVAQDVSISLNLSANGLEFVKGYDDLFVAEGTYRALHLYARNINAYDEEGNLLITSNRTLPILIRFDEPVTLQKGITYKLYIDIYCKAEKGKTIFLTEHNVGGVVHATATIEETGITSVV